MPTVPGAQGINTSDSGVSPMATPTPANLLMAAADMHSAGALAKSSQPDPLKAKKRNRPLKVVK